MTDGGRDDALDRADEPGPGAPDDVLMAQELGVRAFWLTAPNMQGLLDRLVLVLGEHMDRGDELHITSDAIQAGWQQHPGRNRTLLHRAREPWTELHFEYSALVILRGPRR